MTPKIKISPDKQISILSFIRFGRLSDSEIGLISSLLAIRDGLSVTLDSSTTNEIESNTGLNSAAISTYLHRLGKKGVIKKSGRVINFHPIYSVIDSKALLISFE